MKLSSSASYPPIFYSYKLLEFSILISLQILFIIVDSEIEISRLGIILLDPNCVLTLVVLFDLGDQCCSCSLNVNVTL